MGTLNKDLRNDFISEANVEKMLIRDLSFNQCRIKLGLLSNELHNK